MLSARSLVMLIVAALALALVINVLGLRTDPDSGGAGRDSYGLRAHGYRGTLELLREIGVSAERRIGPSLGADTAGTTVALLAPLESIVAREPTYLQRLSAWVEAGGRVVVAPPTDEAIDRQEGCAACGNDFVPDADLLESLGLTGVKVVDDYKMPEEDDSFSWESLRWRQSRAQGPVESHEWVFNRNGAESRLTLALPTGYNRRLTYGKKPCRVILSSESSSFVDEENVLAAAFARGKGEVVVVADPELFANALIDEEQNAVAVVRLLSPTGGPVVFDEHYHGLSVRGNVLYLLTRPGFTAVTLGVLLATAVWAWRTAVPLGPPLQTPAKPRRDLAEYVGAMSRLLLRGRDGRRFLLQELRQGVLEELGRQFNLTALTPTTKQVAAAVARRDPARARRFTQALDAIDSRLAEPGTISKDETTKLMKGTNSCL